MGDNSAADATSGDTASFGFRNVGIGEKQDLVDDVFHRVARRYDLMNDVMSGGLHRLWKDAMVAWLAPPKSGKRAYEFLDVAGGTGDIAFRIIEASGRHARGTVYDINGSMLDVGRERAEKQGLGRLVRFVEGNAEVLPFDGNSFDAYTI
ncbi:MAG: class I SAM-dependent methyltransferase, partial [Hyphomicrobiales bacterium]|nr:class I SAM-dependent methyltransferase [Hyphomicrobiales bacterium]